jgi:YVTN family beta-propeller protein
MSFTLYPHTRRAFARHVRGVALSALVAAGMLAALAPPSGACCGRFAVVATVPVGPQPIGIAVNPVTNRIYAANAGSNTVSTINGSNNSIVGQATVGPNPFGVAVDTAINRIFTIHPGIKTVTVVDGRTNLGFRAIQLADAPLAAAANPRSNLVYTADGSSGNVTVINTVTFAVGTIHVGGDLRDVAVNPTTDRIYTVDFGAGVDVFDGTTNNFLANMPAAGTTSLGVAVDSALNRIYVAYSGSNSVAIFAGASNALIGTVAVGIAPRGVAVNSTTHLAYVANSSLNAATNASTVSVIGFVSGPTIFPSAWTLRAAGPIGKGVTLRPVLKKPRLIGLVVFNLAKHTLVGLVPLGRHSGSKQRIPWNLKVNGKTLGNGTYEVDLRVFTAAGKPTNLPGPRSERLVIRNGRVRVSP